MSLKLYANLISQPSRAVAWLLQVKQLPHELVLVRPPEGVTPELRRLNPNGLIPVLEDGDFSVFESGAIMAYLANEHQWTDVYPTEPRARAKVDQYLHWHHTNARQITTKVFRVLMMRTVAEATPEQLAGDLFRPYAKRNWGKPTPEILQLIRDKDAIIGGVVDKLEQFLVKSYVAESETPTLADFQCYCELDQIEALGVFEFKPFPKTLAWMQRMKQLPHHDQVREPMRTLVSQINCQPVP